MTESNKKAQPKFASAPLVSHMYTADPSAHSFNGKIYIYPSHDIEGGIPFNDNGDHFQMEDYHVFSMDEPFGEVTDHGLALHVDDVPWATRQMWAPDCAHKDGKYYFYFPAKTADDIFYIGVAVSDSPTGPFKPQPEPIKGSFSIDPAVYEDDDGAYYLYFGGIWGGQLQRWPTGSFSQEDQYPADDEPALCGKVARLRDDMLEFDEAPRDIVIMDEKGDPVTTGDNVRRYFEGPWVHKHNGVYYFSYSTGDTHCIAYATGDSPYGPFTYRGTLLEPVLGWTNHHSVVKHDGKWYLFYHDCELSEGDTHLRNIKMAELHYNEDGSIQTISAYQK
ncbi:glycoside hydrolase family 43 protein [Marinimicrobium alkaliphilum]|uniref:glycoside hydrolase family 43 protein n=1 Tax=Marinimicrobium alkaliphilum TaxID=2202654 RepID=UPI000DBA1FFA|nr:glycoside hydrolase family 43 protein [Marinimicrobium alkaliphilum]